jgi:PAT family beta-lactamase induction signal transducer AmpG
VILAVYGYQGLVAGFAVTALPNWMAAQGASVAEIGAYLALTGLPWMAQPLWGPVVDRFGGSRMGARRAWVLAGFAGALACLAALPLAGAALPAIGLVLLAHNAFAALVDTAMDGLIIDSVPQRRLGQATALTRMGFTGGMALGAALFASAIPALGLPASGLLLAAIGTAAAAMPLLVREAAGDAHLSLRAAAARPAGPSLGRMLARLAAEARRREVLALLALCVTVEFAVGAFGLRLSVALVQEKGWDPAALSRLQGALALAGGTLGALLVAAWVDRAGPARAVVALLAAAALGHAAAGLLVREGAGGAQAVALALSALLPALFFVALAPAVMLASRGEAAATRFTLFMASLNLGGILGAAAAGRLAEWLPTGQMGLAAGLVLAGCAAAAASPRLPLRRAAG